MQQYPEITVRIAGDDATAGEVGLDDLNLLCSRLSKALKATERSTSGNARSSLEYRLTGLEHGSAALVIQPRGSAALVEETVSLFNATIDALETGGEIDSRLDRLAVTAFQRLGDLGRLTLSVGSRRITESYSAYADAWLHQTVATYGAVKGRIKRLDLRGPTMRFGLYPLGSSKAVECSFDQKLLETVRDATNRSATVYGRITYWGTDASPATADVEQIIVHRTTDSSPSFASLRGTLPLDATGGLDAVECVRSLRDDE